MKKPTQGISISFSSKRNRIARGSSPRLNLIRRKNQFYAGLYGKQQSLVFISGTCGSTNYPTELLTLSLFKLKCF